MYYFIVNPNSGNGRGLRNWNVLLRYLNRKRIGYSAFLTAAPGEARLKAAELTENRTDEITIIIVGGDGTVNEVLDGLSMNAKTVIGIIPSGSGNDLAKSLKIPKNTKKCIKRIISGCPRCIDYGVISYGSVENLNRRFVISSGIGFDAAVCHDLLESRMKDALNKVRMGRVAYFMQGLKEFLLSTPVKGYILLDGVKKVEFNHILFISAHIMPYEGGGYMFAPKADCQDGKLEICVVSSRNRLRLVPAVFFAKYRAQKNCRCFKLFECREAHIHTEIPLAVHADGESCKYQTDIDVRCVERRLRFIY